MKDPFDKTYDELTEEERAKRYEEVNRIRASDQTPARVLYMPEGVNYDHILKKHGKSNKDKDVAKERQVMTGFKRELGKENIENLKQEELFTEKLLPDIEKGDVFFAIRPNREGSFYLKGRSLFSYDKNGFSTHRKFAFIPSDVKKTYITEADLEKMNAIKKFKDGYERIKEQLALFADDEAEGVSALYAFAPHARNTGEEYFLVDIEVVFNSENDTESQKDRIDILLYDNNEKRLLFCEVKLFSNREVWTKEGGKLKVIKQLERYNKQIADRKDEILNVYAAAFEEYNQLMGTELCMPESVCEQCLLLVFGFNREGLTEIKKWLDDDEDAKNHKYRLIGNITSLFGSTKNAVKDLFKNASKNYLKKA
jgi:hypothetical protein